MSVSSIIPILPFTDWSNVTNISSKLFGNVYETKLFWALQRCLVVNPEDRYYLII